MSDSEMQQSGERQLDVRGVSDQRRLQLVFAAYQQLELDQSLILVNDDALDALHDELEHELAGAFSWETLASADQHDRVRITKRATTALPRTVADTQALLATSAPDDEGSIWQLTPGARDLDSNIIALPAHDEIAQHTGPDLDVLILILQGSGELQTELDVVRLEEGDVVWLPRKAQRRFIAGPEGIRYFTVHQRKPTLNITSRPTDS